MLALKSNNTLKKTRGGLSQLSVLQTGNKVALMKHFLSSFMNLDHGFTEVSAAFSSMALLRAGFLTWVNNVDGVSLE